MFHADGLFLLKESYASALNGEKRCCMVNIGTSMEGFFLRLYSYTMLSTKASEKKQYYGKIIDKK